MVNRSGSMIPHPWMTVFSQVTSCVFHFKEGFKPDSRSFSSRGRVVFIRSPRWRWRAKNERTKQKSAPNRVPGMMCQHFVCVSGLCSVLLKMAVEHPTVLPEVGHPTVLPEVGHPTVLPEVTVR